MDVHYTYHVKELTSDESQATPAAKQNGSIRQSTTQSDSHAASELPQTNEHRTTIWSVLGLGLMSILSLFGIGKQRKHENN